MSIASTTRKAGPYTGNGLTTIFTFPFKVFQASDLLVVRTDLIGLETTLALTTDYTVSLNVNQDANPGGVVVMNVAPATSYLITLSSAVAELQPVVLTNNGGFYPSVINDALDRLTILTQQISEQVSRAVKVSISSSTNPDDLIASVISNTASAAASAASALASWQSFEGIYYGVYVSAPSTDPLGNPIGVGDLYYNSSTQSLQIYTSTGWQASAQSTPVSYTNQTFNGTGSQTNFTLSSTPASIDAIEVFISGIRQYPTTNFTIAGTTLTFVTAPASGTNNILVRWTYALAVGTPNDNSVTTAKIQNLAVSTAKLADNAVTPAKLANSGNELGSRNRLINGCFRVDQRNSGTAVSLAVSGINYYLDRWYVYSVGATGTIQQDDNISLSGKRLRINGATGMTSVAVGQRIESINCKDLAGSTVTLFAILSNSSNGSVSWNAYYANTTDSFGTVSSPTRTLIAAGTFNPTTTPTAFSATFAVPSAAVTGIEIIFRGGAQSSGSTWYIEQVQLEKGSTATPFEYRPYGAELALCQRYLPVCRGNYTNLVGQKTAATAAKVTFTFKTTARIAPTGIVSSDSFYVLDASGGVGYPVTTAALSGSSIDGAFINLTGITGLGATAGQAAIAYGSFYLTGCEL